MTPEEEQIRAEEANQLLKHPVMIAAFRDIETKLIDALAQFDIEPERVQRLQAALAGKRAFERVLKTYIQTGLLVLEEQRRKSLLTKSREFFRAA